MVTREGSDVARTGYVVINFAPPSGSGMKEHVSGTQNSRRNVSGPRLMKPRTVTTRSLGALGSSVHDKMRSRRYTRA